MMIQGDVLDIALVKFIVGMSDAELVCIDG